MQTLKHTGISNLFRCEASGIYYAIVKVNGKQKRRNLKTRDKEIARRKMEDFRQKVARLTTDDARKMPFAEYDDKGVLIGGLVKRWWDAQSRYSSRCAGCCSTCAPRCPSRPVSPTGSSR
jgi:hypothetical protein